MKLVASCISLALVAAAASAGASSPATLPQGAAKLRSCGTLTGPKWTIPYTGGKKTGTRYQVAALKFSCSSAIRYVKKFYVRRSHGVGKRLTGGPAGYRCQSLTLSGYRIFQGVCRKTRNRKFAAGFTWGVKDR